MSAITDAVTTTEQPLGLSDGSVHIEWPDYLVIALYFVGILGVGFWVGASLFSSNVGSGQFVGLAGSGASSGLSIAAFELNVSTMPEYLRKRFGGQRIRIYMSVLAILLYIFTKISADLYAGALFIKQSLGLNMYVSVVILLAISAVFTMAGGLTTVIWTDTVQTFLMVIGALVLTILSFNEVGSKYHNPSGYNELMDNFRTRGESKNPSYIIIDNSTGQSCSAITPYYRNLLRPWDDADLPWTGMVFGITISAVWYWCSDQVIVQRALSARSYSHAKAGCTLCSFIKISPFYLLVMPGMAARVLWPDEVGCSNPDICKKICGSESGCSNIAYPLLVLRLMPAGLTGLMLSVMMAALMSSLTSIFNSASTIFTIDIYNRFRKQASEVEQVIAGRIFVLFLVAVSILWIPIIESSQNSQLFNYIQSVTSYLAPPVCAVYVLAMFWGRINEKGAFWGLMIGLVIGIIRFVMEFSYTVPTCGSGIADPRPTILSKVHYLHFGIILFLISSAVTIAISLFTKAIDEKHLYRLTYWSRGSHEVREDIDADAVTESETCGQTNNGFVAEDGTESATTGPQNNNVVSKSGDNENRSRLLYTLCCVGSGNKSAEEGEKGNDGEVGVIPLTKEEDAIRCANDVKETPVWRSVNNLFA
ncbi:unnamed protein product, partial [Medioppia subpectinata]